ncbi:hypothetical protein C2869_04405 [Saccharobesus litoralis]|uniref:RHS repeat-associated core domain-containing protein n=2 Tax=Saccharobesus litoralis TaxID=2172099 RepID=A0A2S0VXG6_9ALTE|nr:hypothetical protein C2869_04405 [Saccharobesus litoralis]
MLATGFIHMKGRVYDPIIGRFLSPDPIVQAPYFSQSWNSYTYGWNNPLRYTDPSGYTNDDEACQRKSEGGNCQKVEKKCDSGECHTVYGSYELQRQIKFYERIHRYRNNSRRHDRAREGQAALDLISEHKYSISSSARSMGVDPQHVASIIFQEKYHGVWAKLKNVPAWMMILVGINDASVGLAEMDINTAALLLGVDTSTMSSDTRNQIINLLANDRTAISLISLNVASFQERLGRPVSVQEATYGHNAGVNALARDLPISQGSPVSRRSWGHQDAIADALK